MEPITMALLGAGLNAGGSLFNLIGQGVANRRNRQFALDMYNRQRADALEFWRMQNEYNTPAAQMARFRAAGLNPALVYERGSTGQAGAISTPSAQSLNVQPLRYGDVLASGHAGYMSTLSAYQDMELRQAQADNVKAQADVIAQEVALKAAQTMQTIANTERSTFDLSLARELRGTSVEAARESLRQLKQSIDLAQQRDEREAVAQSATLQEAAQRVANMKLEALRIQAETARSKAERARVYADIERIKMNVNTLKYDNDLKRLEVSMREKGLTFSDPLITRLAASSIEAYLSGRTDTSHWANIWRLIERWID